MSTKLVRTAAVAAAGVALAAGMLANSAPAAAAPTINACSPTVGTPFKNGGEVWGKAVSAGCGTAWDWTATLQSSRWWGWNDDVQETWRGASGVTLRAGCAGTHDFRMVLNGTDHISNVRKFSAVVTIAC